MQWLPVQCKHMSQNEQSTLLINYRWNDAELSFNKKAKRINLSHPKGWNWALPPSDVCICQPILQLIKISIPKWSLEKKTTSPTVELNHRRQVQRIIITNIVHTVSIQSCPFLRRQPLYPKMVSRHLQHHSQATFHILTTYLLPPFLVFFTLIITVPSIGRWMAYWLMVARIALLLLTPIDRWAIVNVSHSIFIYSSFNVLFTNLALHRHKHVVCHLRWSPVTATNSHLASVDISGVIIVWNVLESSPLTVILASNETKVVNFFNWICLDQNINGSCNDNSLNLIEKSTPDNNDGQKSKVQQDSVAYKSNLPKSSFLLAFYQHTNSFVLYDAELGEPVVKWLVEHQVSHVAFNPFFTFNRSCDFSVHNL